MQKNYDLIVAGGGTAGALCAIAAARSGVKTAVIEPLYSLGGLAANSGLTEMNAAGFQGKPLYKGIEQEILNRLLETGHGEYHFAVPMSSDPNVRVDRFRYDPEALKLVLEQLAMEAGVELFYGCTVYEAQETDAECVLQVRSGCKSFTLKSLYTVDATGDASVVCAMGGATRVADADKRMIATLMFRISRVDTARLQQAMQGGVIREAIQKGRAEGVLQGAILAFTPIPGTDDVSLNVTRVKCDHEDPRSLSRGLAEARAQIEPVFRFVQKNVPGLENAYVSGIAPILGVRDARRIQAAHTLTLAELESMQEFEDSVACGCYPMDIHDPVTNSVIWKMLPGVYHIPYRSLLPRGLHRVLAAGKCLDADDQAFGAVRVQPIVMNMGESAGYAVALALKNGCCLDELNTAELRQCLAESYRNA